MPTPATSPRHGSGVDADDPGRGGRLSAAAASRYLAVAIAAALVLLLVEVLLESWVQELSSNRSLGADGKPVGELAEWPKDLKSGLYLLLAGLSLVKILVERRWREFTTRGDIALAALAVVMATAGLVGSSGLALTGEGMFVYLRGAIVFYAVRALRPTWAQVTRVLWVLGGLVVVHVVIAFAQTIAGRPAYTAVGIVDSFAARNYRGQGLLHHPNDLGHVLGLVLIGLLAWLSGLPRVAPDPTQRRLRRWAWAGVAVAALGLGATQSRESVLAVLAALAVMWFLRRAGFRTLLVGAVVIAVGFGVNLVARPSHLAGLAGRLGGVTAAVDTPSGQEECSDYVTTSDCVHAGQVEYRELRVLFLQQGAQLLAHRPVLGYGVGHFGGIVAEKRDPNWDQNPRLPGGFDLHDLDGTTVDVFWLHLVVETGVLGLLTYLVWLWLLAVPPLGVTRRYAGRRVWGASGARAPVGKSGQALALWGVCTLLFAVLAGFFSNAPLEGPIFPPLLFALLGLGWVLTRDPQPRHARDPQPRHARGEDV